MPLFLKLTRDNVADNAADNKIIVNASRICHIEKAEYTDGTIIDLGGEDFIVEETPDQIEEMMSKGRGECACPVVAADEE